MERAGKRDRRASVTETKTMRSGRAREWESEAEATPVGRQVEVAQASRPRSGGARREEGLDGRLTSSEMAKQSKNAQLP